MKSEQNKNGEREIERRRSREMKREKGEKI